MFSLQLALLGAGTATREAAVSERVAAAEGAAEEKALRLRAEVQRCVWCVVCVVCVVCEKCNVCKCSMQCVVCERCSV